MFKIKKVFIISSIGFGVVLVLFLLFNFVFKNNNASKNKNTITDIVDNSSSSKDDAVVDDSIENNKEKIYLLTEEVVISPVLSEDESSVFYYDQSTGKSLSVTVNGKGKIELSRDELVGLKNVEWSPSRTKVISRFERNGGFKHYYYDYEKKAGIKLPEDFDAVRWDNLGNKIFFKKYDEKKRKRKLYLSNVDGTDEQLITADVFHEEIKLVNIPQTSLISFWNFPSAFSKTSLRVVSINGGEAKEIFTDRYGVDYLWSWNGKESLVSSVEKKGGSKVMLGIINENGGEYRSLNIPTFVSKCVWGRDNKTVYYALPGGLSEKAVLPDQYINKEIKTRDTFWKVDITTGRKERLVELEDIKESYDADQLFLNTPEYLLFFVNRHDGKLYVLQIDQEKKAE